MTAYPQRPSPNRRPRTAEERVRLVLLHGTYMADDEDALQRLTDAATEVSCHYYVTRKGEVLQLVAEEDVAWHAGKSQWTLPDGTTLNGLNGHSLGIELGNAGPFGHIYPKGPPSTLEQAPDWSQAEPFPAVQLEALVRLLQEILTRHNLGPEAVVMHSQVAPGRKTDPGHHFPMAQVRERLS